MGFESKTRARRAAQRGELIACAEQAISDSGLTAVRARSLADCVGCSVGAIYNLVADLDELILLVGQRTMAELNAYLDAAEPGNSGPVEGRLSAWALAYCRFAAANRNRWQALFEFRLSPGRQLPDWFETDQMRLFERLEAELATHFQTLDLPTRRLRARTLFSAVHGIVSLGLEEKIGTMPITALEAELSAFVRAYVSSLGT